MWTLTPRLFVWFILVPIQASGVRYPTEARFRRLLTHPFTATIWGSGIPLSIACSDGHKSEMSEDREEVTWLHYSVILRFVFGFWLRCGALVFLQPWRSLVIQFADCLVIRLCGKCCQSKVPFICRTEGVKAWCRPFSWELGFSVTTFFHNFIQRNSYHNLLALHRVKPSKNYLFLCHRILSTTTTRGQGDWPDGQGSQHNRAKEAKDHGQWMVSWASNCWATLSVE